MAADDEGRVERDRPACEEGRVATFDAGWYAVRSIDDGAPLRATVYARFVDVLDATPAGAIIAVDIPIGLREVGARACPDVRFAVMNGGMPMRSPKKQRAGREARLALLGEVFGVEPERMQIDERLRR